MSLRRKPPGPAYDFVLEQLAARLSRRPQEDDPHPERPHLQHVSGLHDSRTPTTKKPDCTAETNARDLWGVKTQFASREIRLLWPERR